MNPLVSIIIPAYNSDRFIVDAVESILAQTYRPIEVIVVDDGSVDNTKRVLEKFGDSIDYIYQINQGVSSARNIGISKSKGEYIIFLDADDMLCPDMIERCVEAFKSNPDYRVVYGIAYRLEEEHKTITEYMYTPRQSGSIFEFITKGLMLAQGQYILKRQCVEEIGGFDVNSSSYGEDWQFQLKMTKSYKFLYVPSSFVKKRIHSYMFTLNKSEKIDFVRNRFSILDKTFGKEAKQIKKRYITRKVVADWYLCCNKKWISFITYPWQPRMYLELLKQHLSPSTKKKIVAIKNTFIGSRNEL